jgi:alpha-amylase
MKYFCPIIRAHQPIRLNLNFPYERVEKIASGTPIMDRYFDEKMNHDLFLDLVKECYIPTFKGLHEIIVNSEKEFKLALTLSGPFLEQVIKFSPDLIEEIRKLVSYGTIELLGEDYYHSLTNIYVRDQQELVDQIVQYIQFTKKMFDIEPKIFRNTGLIYNNFLVKILCDLGFEGTVVEGVPSILGNKHPSQIYTSLHNNVKLILINREVSNILLSHFYEKNDRSSNFWAVDCANILSSFGDITFIEVPIEIFYKSDLKNRTFLDFFIDLNSEMINRKNLSWINPGEAINKIPSVGTISVPEVLSISGMGKKDLNPWLENFMQRISLDRIVNLTPYIKEISDSNITKIWKLLHQSDFLLGMSTRKSDENAVDDQHFKHYNPAEIFAAFNAVYTDFEGKIATVVHKRRKSKSVLNTDQQKNMGSMDLNPPKPIIKHNQRIQEEKSDIIDRMDRLEDTIKEFLVMSKEQSTIKSNKKYINNQLSLS